MFSHRVDFLWALLNQWAKKLSSRQGPVSRDWVVGALKQGRTPETTREFDGPYVWILWPPDAKNWLFGKDSDAGKDWRQEKGTTEVEMVRWHHQLDGREFEQTLGDSEGQGCLVCYSPRGLKELEMKQWLKNSIIHLVMFFQTCGIKHVMHTCAWTYRSVYVCVSSSSSTCVGYLVCFWNKLIY